MVSCTIDSATVEFRDLTKIDWKWYLQKGCLGEMVELGHNICVQHQVFLTRHLKGRNCLSVCLPVLSVVVEAQWPIGYGVGLRIKRSSVRIRPWPLRWVFGQGSLLPLSQGEAFTLASISYLAILVKYILAKKKMSLPLLQHKAAVVQQWRLHVATVGRDIASKCLFSVFSWHWQCCFR